MVADPTTLTFDESDAFGDPSEVPCPWCGHQHDLSDPVNELGPEYENEPETCNSCGQTFYIDSINYDVTVTLRRDK